MQRWLFGVLLASTIALGACETSAPQASPAAMPAASAEGPASDSSILEGVAVDAPIPGLPGATWSDPKNTGYVTGYTYKGQYHAGPPPAYDRNTHSVVNR